MGAIWSALRPAQSRCGVRARERFWAASSTRLAARAFVPFVLDAVPVTSGQRASRNPGATTARMPLAASVFSQLS
ncbi:MAG: hypothetical protein BMS9Abin01_2616 [Gammaproteobacteria bacterium]|nr:MAG: hypothetical protein BMS9Abin01_2616 [Gammaproteobacteria bacterium]